MGIEAFNVDDGLNSREILESGGSGLLPAREPRIYSSSRTAWTSLVS